MERKALDGIRVLDLTQFLAGPVCTSTLGMLGADVIKIERPKLGEQGRSDNRPYQQGDMSLKWAILHCNKKSATLNLKTEDGRGILTELIRVSDVLIENYAPGTIERLGFSWEKIHEINHRIIFAQIKGYNDASPFAKYPAMDGPVQATGGVASQTGLESDPVPIVSNISLADAPSGMYALSAILAALYQRTVTGEGQHVRVNMQEVCMDYSRAAFAVQDRPQKRGGAMTFSGEQAPRGMFRCKPAFDGDEDNFVFVMVRDAPGQRNWKVFCDIIGHPEYFDDPRFLNGPLRLKNVKDTNRITEEWTSTLDKKDVMRILCENKLPAGAVMGVLDFMQSEDLYDCGFLQKMDQPHMGEVTIPASALHMSDSPVQVTPAPDLGNGNDYVYKDILGYSDEKIAELMGKDAI